MKVKDYVRSHWVLFLLGLAVLGAYWLINRLLESQASHIGPEFLIRVPIRIFNVIAAAWLTLHADKWVAPVLSGWCAKGEDGAKSEFEKAWLQNPSDPRIRLCVLFYCALFVGLCVAFSL